MKNYFRRYFIRPIKKIPVVDVDSDHKIDLYNKLKDRWIGAPIQNARSKPSDAFKIVPDIKSKYFVFINEGRQQAKIIYDNSELAISFKAFVNERLIVLL